MRVTGGPSLGVPRQDVHSRARSADSRVERPVARTGFAGRQAEAEATRMVIHIPDAAFVPVARVSLDQPAPTDMDAQRLQARRVIGASQMKLSIPQQAFESRQDPGARSAPPQTGGQ
ncbi:MAG: hypothetical protein AB7F28_05880 [Candidatus Margulisiibacteriota bacterium]